MGKNKLAKFAEMARFENVFQPSFDELVSSPFPLKGMWAEKYFGNRSPLILELGCGKGEYTTELATRFPHQNFIGVDIKGARMFTGARQAIEKGLGNVAFIRTRIENICYLFGPGEVDEIWLTFPDPQMKNTRKRLTSSCFLQKYSRFLKPEGIIHLKTDSRFQYNYTLGLLQVNGLKLLASTNNLYASGLLNEILSIRTFYEKQWIERGLPIHYLAFSIGHHQNWVEPADHFERDEYRSFGRSARN